MRTHLPHCRSCRSTVQSTELAMGGLGMVVPQVDPPARLRSNLLAHVAETPQEPRSTTSTNRFASGRRTRPARSSSPATRADAGAGPRPDARGGSGRQPIRGRRRLAAISLAVAALLGFGGLTTYAVHAQQERDAQISQTQALADLLARSGQAGAVRATLNTDAGQPVAAVVASASGPTVVTAGLAPNERDTSTYVLWGIDGNGPRPLSTFDVLPGTVAYPLAAPNRDFTAYAISLEAGRIMPATPSTVVATGPVLA